MRKLFCWLLGHRWYPIGAAEYVSDVIRCKHCGKTRDIQSLFSAYETHNTSPR